MKKYLLPGMMAALAFAACTNEEIVSQQTSEAPKADLSNRPVAGMVDLNFGPQTRATIGSNFNTVEWDAGVDKIGARVIDNLKNGDPKKCHSVHNYEISDNRAWSNYRYDYNEGGNWTSDALMVEGNYMFYAPYDENALYREPLKIKFPTTQYAEGLTAIKDYTKGAVNGNQSVIDNFYGNKKGQTVTVGHTFVDAKDGGMSVTPIMTHLYAYPLITVVNDYVGPVIGEDGEPKKDSEGAVILKAQDITIDQIMIESDNIFANYKIDQRQLVNALKLEVAAHKVNNDNDTNDEGEHAKENEGAWLKGGKLAYNTKTFLTTASTDYILNSDPIYTDEAKGIVSPDGKIVVELDEALQIPAGYAVKLNVVMPAATYAKDNFKVNVRVIAGVDEEGDTIYKKFNINASAQDAKFEGDGYSDQFVYAVSKQIPNEEYNMKANGTTEAKPTTWGTLATFKLKGDLVDINAIIVDPGNIANNPQFLTWLQGISDNSTNKYEKVYENGEEVDVPEVGRKGDFRLTANHNVEINETFLTNVSEYLNAGKIYFQSNLTVKGSDKADQPLVIDGAKYPKFSKLTVKEGYVKLKNTTVAELVINSGAVVSLEGATIGEISDIRGNVTLTGGTLTAAKNQNNQKILTFHGAPTLNGVTIVADKVIFKEYAKINGGKYPTAEFQKGGEVNNRNNSGVDASGSATVTNGTLKATAKSAWNTVNLYGGNMEITNNAYKPAVMIGGTKGTDGLTSDKNGQLTANAKDLVLPNVALNTKDSKLIVSQDLALTAFSWSKGSVENSAKLTLPTAGVTVPKDHSYTHNAGASVVNALTNAGTVYNNGVLTLTNNGEVVVGEGGLTRTNINANLTGTSGRIDNTELGYITLDPSASQTIYVKTGAFANNAAWKDFEDYSDASTHKVNTFHIDGLWTVTNIDDLLPVGYALEFASTDGVQLGAVTVNLGSIPAKIMANQTWRGLGADASKVSATAMTFGSNESGAYYTLTAQDVDLNAAYVAAIQSAIQAGGNVTLTTDVTLTSALTIPAAKNVVINLGGKTLKSTTEGTGDDITISAGAKLTVQGGKVETSQTAFFNNGGELTLTGCEIVANNSGATAVSSNGGTMNITGGSIKCLEDAQSDYYVVAYRNGAQGTINTTVEGKKMGALTVIKGASVTVSGGTYKAGRFYGLYVGGATANYNIANAEFIGAEDENDICVSDADYGASTINSAYVSGTHFYEDDDHPANN